MVLVAVRWEAGLVAWWPKTRTENKQNDSLKQELTYSFSGVDEEER
jgi:hypothetical protein